MKRLNIVLAALFLLAAIPAIYAAESVDTVISCRLDDGTHATLKAESRGLDGKALIVEVSGQTQPAFLDMPDMDYVGQIVLAICVGKALVFAQESGSPYLKGVVVRKNPQTHAEERINFAEKSLPRWLYLGRHEMLLIIPNEGYETNKRYLVYRSVQGKGQPEESTPMDNLPVSRKLLYRVKSNSDQSRDGGS